MYFIVLKQSNRVEIPTSFQPPLDVNSIYYNTYPSNLLWLLSLLFQDISLDNLASELPAHQPRYIAYSYCYTHDDGRVSYPLVFFFVSPQGE